MDLQVRQGIRGLPVEAAAETYVTNIVKMNKLSASFKYKFLCVIQPEVGSQEAYRRFRDIAKSGLSKNQVQFLDLEEVKQITDDMFLDAVHTDSAGHKLMAEIVARRITQDHMLPAEGIREVRSHKNAAPAPVD